MSVITRRLLLGGAGALAASPGLAQPAPASPRPRVAVATALGQVVIELAADKAPVTCANFLRYVDAKAYDQGMFYRAVVARAEPPAGLVQGGLNQRPVQRFEPIAHESTQLTGLAHVDGAISMSRNAPGTATSEFFICVGDVPSLNADPSLPGDNQGFAVFGRVAEGMDVVRKVLLSPRSPDKGADWGMKGQILDPEIPFVSVKRI